MRFNEALRDLQYRRSSKFALYGNEDYLKFLFLNSARSMDFIVLSYYPGEEEEAKESLCSGCLFEGERLIILNYFDEMNWSGFKDLIKRFNGLLILVLSGEADIKLKELTEILSTCVMVSCNKMSEYGKDYPVWLTIKASEKGFTFVNNAEDFLYKRVGPDMFSLAFELEKLMIYKEQEKVITVDDVDKVVSFSAESSAYDILEYILKKDIVKLMKALELYFKRSNDAEGLIFFLEYYFEKLYRIAVMSENGVSPRDIAFILNMHPFLIKSKYLPLVISLGRKEILRYLEDLVKLEGDIINSSIKEILFNKFIFSLV